MSAKKYEKYEFCTSVFCWSLCEDAATKKKFCYEPRGDYCKFTANNFHKWLNDNGYKITKESTMPEQQSQYGKKTTYTEALKDITSFAQQKMLENTHKPDPLSEGFDVLVQNVFDEFMEFDESIDEWMVTGSKENIIEIKKEAGDLINTVLYLCLWVESYRVIIRE